MGANLSTASWYEQVSRPAPGTFGLRGRVVFILGLAAAIAGLNLYAPAAPGVTERLLASGALILAALPTWLWLGGTDRNLPFMPFFGFAYAAIFLAPLFLVPDYRVNWSTAEIQPQLITRALELIGLGLLCVMAGYYGPQRALVEQFLPRIQLRWERPGFITLGGVVFGIAGLASYGLVRNFPDQLQMVVAFAGDLCAIGICMLFALQLVGLLDRLSTLFLWMVLVPARIWLGLATGLTSEGLSVVMLMLLLYASIRRRIPWAAIAIGGLLFFILRPVEGNYRFAQGYAMRSATVLEKSKLLIAIGEQTVVPMIDGNSGAYDASMEVASRRLSVDLLTFAAVIGDTPRAVPYWRGATYYPILFKLVPRFLYPDKPQEVTGQTFGHRYGLLDAYNFQTSYNLPQLIESYINFGVGGVIIVMFLLGMLYRAVQGVLVHPRMGLGAVILGSYLCTGLLNIESAASFVIGVAVWTFVYVGLLNLVIQSGELHATPPGRVANTEFSAIGHEL
ncbi:MAG TPA: hypothetical protein VJN94_03070 [Candidatus Binataceae bacterium]|nr:hypothetical protein [Candidatus Binataceae bacterium]